MNLKQLLDLVSEWEAPEEMRDWLSLFDPERKAIEVLGNLSVSNIDWLRWLEEELQERIPTKYGSREWNISSHAWTIFWNTQDVMWSMLKQTEIPILESRLSQLISKSE